MKHLNRVLLLTVSAAALAGSVSACARSTPAPAPAPVSVVTPAAEAAPADAGATTPATDSLPDLPPPTIEPTIEPAPDPAPAKPRVKKAPGLTGTHYGYVTAVDEAARTITFDKVEWFTGAAARKACKTDGVPIGDGASCNDYYIRNHNPKLRTAPLSPAAKLSLQSPYDIMVQLEIPLDQLAAEYEHRLFIITVTDGRATRVKEQFTP
jgi:hypothetical protein